MPNRFALSTLLVGTVLAFTATHAHAQAREEGKLLMATEVLDELRTSRDQFIPDRLLDRAYGIAVIPDVAKIAFFAGARRGTGALVVRDKNGRFSSPVFVALTGGSFGWQWGVQSTDIVLVFTTREGIEGMAGGKVTLGADASVAAGPVGRQAAAATDPSFSAEVYSYSRARGLFAGVALDGTALTIDKKANAAFYKKSTVTATDIINGAVTSDDDASRRFLAAVASSTATTHTTASAAPLGAAPPPSAPAEPALPAATTGTTGTSGAAGTTRTFPMEDAKPGQEPK